MCIFELLIRFGLINSYTALYFYAAVFIHYSVFVTCGTLHFISCNLVGILLLNQPIKRPHNPLKITLEQVSLFPVSLTILRSALNGLNCTCLLAYKS